MFKNICYAKILARTAIAPGHTVSSSKSETKVSFQQKSSAKSGLGRTLAWYFYSSEIIGLNFHVKIPFDIKNSPIYHEISFLQKFQSISHQFLNFVGDLILPLVIGM